MGSSAMTCMNARISDPQLVKSNWDFFSQGSPRLSIDPEAFSLLKDNTEAFCPSPNTLLVITMSFCDHKLWPIGRKPIKNILLSYIFAKIFLNWIRPLHHVKIQKVESLQKWPFCFGGEGAIYTYPNNVFSWRNESFWETLQYRLLCKYYM